jgi:SAM-dependent methyltransferase
MAPLDPEYWNGLAGRLGEPQFQKQIALYKRRENLELVAAWAPRGGRRLLKTDVFEEAYGDDLLLDALAQTYPIVVGMDVSHTVAATASARLPGLPFVVSDACSLPFKAGSFDLVVSISTLDHLPADLLPRAVDQLRDVLKPGGCLILTLDSRHNPLHVFSNYLRRRMGRIYAERCYTLGEVRAILERHAFLVTDATAIYHVQFPINFLAKTLGKALGARADAPIRWVIRLSRAVGELPTRLLTGRYVALRAIKT